jgi:hypothetical protein
LKKIDGLVRVEVDGEWMVDGRRKTDEGDADEDVDELMRETIRGGQSDSRHRPKYY